MHICSHVNKPLSAGTLLRLVLLAGALLFCLPAQANDASRIVDSPVAIPEALLKQMDTLRLKPGVGTGVVRYMAMQDATALN